jgi:hypothetical protein
VGTHCETYGHGLDSIETTVALAASSSISGDPRFAGDLRRETYKTRLPT